MLGKVKLGDTVHFDISTNSSISGIKDADATPQYWVYEESTDAAVLSGSFTLRSGRVGQYRASIAATTGNGFEAQKYYNIEASGKVDGETGHSVVARFQVENNNYDSLPNITGVVTAVWDEPITNHNVNNTFGSGVLELMGNTYYSMLRCIKDSTNNTDEYVVQWYRNSTPLASGAVTSPTLNVYRTDTGATLVSNKTLSWTSINNGGLRANETINLINSGEPYMATMAGTIDGVSRTWSVPFGVDLLI